MHLHSSAIDVFSLHGYLRLSQSYVKVIYLLAYLLTPDQRLALPILAE